MLYFSDVNECESGIICLNGGTCLNNPGSFTCQCAQGWTGQYCGTGRYQGYHGYQEFQILVIIEIIHVIHECTTVYSCHYKVL